MRICFFTHTIFKIGGVARVTSLIASSLTHHHDVTVVSLNPDFGINHEIYKLDSEIRNVLKPEWYAFTGGSFAEGVEDAIYDFFKTEDFDVIVAVEGMYALRLADILAPFDAVKIAWMHNSYDAYFELEDRYLWGLDAQFKQSIQKYDHCLVLTHGDKARFDAGFAVSSQVIVNPISFSLQSIEKSPLQAPILLTVCRLDMQHKGLDLLIRSFAHIAKRVPEWQLWVVGEGPDEAEISCLIQEYGLNQQVILKGASYDVSAFYETASVFALASRWEGLPMVSLEALAHGIPLVGFKIAALEEVVGSDQTSGILVDCYDTRLFGEALLKLIEDQDLRLELGQGAYQRAHDFELDTIVDQWETLWKEPVL